MGQITEPPIVDTPKSRQPYNGQAVCPLPTTVCMLEPPKKGQPPNNGQKHSCPLFGGSTVVGGENGAYSNKQNKKHLQKNTSKHKNDMQEAEQQQRDKVM